MNIFGADSNNNINWLSELPLADPFQEQDALPSSMQEEPLKPFFLESLFDFPLDYEEEKIAPEQSPKVESNDWDKFVNGFPEKLKLNISRRLLAQMFGDKLISSTTLEGISFTEVLDFIIRILSNYSFENQDIQTASQEL